MDVQLQDLVDKIKKDGVKSAESSAAKIIAEAESKAASIIAEAESKADNIIKSAKAETERMEKASNDAIIQAGRNLIISFRDGINKELSALVNEKVLDVYDKDLMKKLIPDTVKAWANNPDSSDLSVLLSPKDLKVLESTLKTSLKAKISKGLVIKSDSSLSSGFRIGSKDGSAFYDFSAEEVANLFSAYLNPKVTELMKKAATAISEEEKVSTEKKSEEIVETKTKKSTSSKKKEGTSTKKSSSSAKKETVKKGKK